MGVRKKEMADQLKEERKSIAFAKLNDYPTSPRKMRLVADIIRGKEVVAALNILKFTRKHSALPMEKLLRSAISNWQAKNTGEDIATANVVVKEIRVDVSPTLKRISPAPQGRAHRIRKRSNHVTIVLDKKIIQESRMGQKCNPIGNRLGFIKGWDSNWYGGKNYGEKIVEDDKIRKYLMTRLKKASVSKIVIERTLKLVTVTINTARPGIIIGKQGTEVDKLKEELKKLTGKDAQINIFEIKRPEIDARLVADGICRQIEGRISYRRATKMSITSAMKMGA